MFIKLFNWSNSSSELRPLTHIQELHLKAEEKTEIECSADFKPEAILLNSGI